MLQLLPGTDRQRYLPRAGPHGPPSLDHDRVALDRPPERLGPDGQPAHPARHPIRNPACGPAGRPHRVEPMAALVESPEEHEPLRTLLIDADVTAYQCAASVEEAIEWE